MGKLLVGSFPLQGAHPPKPLVLAYRALLPGWLPQCHLFRAAGVLVLCPLSSDL